MDKNEKRYIRVRGQKVEVDITIYREFNNLRKEQYKQNVWHRVNTEELTEEICSSPTELEDAAELRLLAEQLHIALQKLTREEYALIRELFFLGKSERELAQELGTSHSSIRRKVEKIMAKLRFFMKI